jgi:lipoprotein-anchoring transpeptidase ErfK/SrfK
METPLVTTSVNMMLLTTNETTNNNSGNNGETSTNGNDTTASTEATNADQPKEDTTPATTEPQVKTMEALSPPPVITYVSYGLGSRGEEIKAIQQKLNKYGYKLVTDGIFGIKTHKAVLNFQKLNGLTVSGVVDAGTQRKLGIEPKASTSPAATDVDLKTKEEIENYINNQSFPSSTSYFIWIDLKKQNVRIFSGSNNNWKLEKSMLCSTGKATTPTIKGNYSVGSKGSYFIADGGARCKYYTQINGNYLFHSVLYNNSGTRIIDGTLGVPVSHGCVRLAVENAKYIYDNIPKGTAIWSN